MSLFKKCILVAMLAVVAAGGAAYRWATAPLTLPTPAIDVTIQPRSSLRAVVGQLRQGGVPLQPQLFVLMTRALGLSARLKAGNYAFHTGISPYQVLQKIVLGDVNEFVVTIIEGWNFKQMRAAIDASPALRHDTAALSDADLLKAIGAPETNPEGLFFPDTYLFDQGTSDLEIYRRAYRLARRELNDAWLTRAPNLPYKSPYDALIMASLVEKETGKASDRPVVAAVFTNRLRIGMPLQTDPSVIYGLGSQSAGRLRKRDLQTDTPYNTYTRPGLPPTPIALPGAASLQAATHPAASQALYFVARGDGSSVFSNNLDDHNRAVSKYIRGQ